MRSVVISFLVLLLFPFSINIPTSQETEAVDTVCVNRISVSAEGQEFKIPYCRNLPLSGDEPLSIERAVIVVHGANRTAQSYYNAVVTAAMMSDLSEEEVLILAPQFLISEDVQAHTPVFNDWSDVLYWSNNGWKQGDLSKTSDELPRPVRISSFAVMDQILEKLTHTERFPNLKEVVLIGHSAGGQFVQRYAASNSAEGLLAAQEISLRYGVANPSSYLYLTLERPDKAEPGGFSVPAASDCPTYNNYKYGLEDLNQYLSTVGAEWILTNYARHEITYLLGELDTDPQGELLDTGCEAMFQGSQRLERGQNFFASLHDLYGDAIEETQNLIVVPQVGHSSSGIFQSEAGRLLMFGKLAELEVPIATSSPYRVTSEVQPTGTPTAQSISGPSATTTKLAAEMPAGDSENNEDSGRMPVCLSPLLIGVVFVPVLGYRKRK